MRALAAKEQMRPGAGKMSRPQCTATKCRKNVFAIAVAFGHNTVWVLSPPRGSQGKVNQQAEIRHETLAAGCGCPAARKRRFRLGGLRHHYRRSEQERRSVHTTATGRSDVWFGLSDGRFGQPPMGGSGRLPMGGSGRQPMGGSGYPMSGSGYPPMGGGNPTPPPPKPHSDNQVLDFDTPMDKAVG